MYKKGAGNDKQGKDEGNRTLCSYRNFSQAINFRLDGPDRLYGFRSKLKHRILGKMVDKLSAEVVKCYLRSENCR